MGRVLPICANARRLSGQDPQGATPADLPVERAKMLFGGQPEDSGGARPDAPPTFLYRADEVIK